MTVNPDRRLRARARRFVSRELDKRALERVLARENLKQAVLHKNAAPRLLDLQMASASVHDRAVSLVGSLLPSTSESDLAQYREEYAAVAASLASRETTTERLYPEYFTVEEQMSELLYTVVRAAKPQVLLETGVADGHSTSVILDALAANGSGELHSVEISHEVGGLVLDKSRWHLHVTDPSTDDFEKVVASLGTVDLFLHDGDHRYEAQYREYREVWPKMRSGGLFLSDDIDWCWAYVHFLDLHGLKPHTLMERRKATGACIKP